MDPEPEPISTGPTSIVEYETDIIDHADARLAQFAHVHGTKVVKILAGKSHSVALTVEGFVMLWGVLCSGGVVHSNCPKPRYVLLPERCTDLAVGDGHIVVIGKSGSVFGCGSSSHGQLGSRHDEMADFGDGTLKADKVFAAGNHSFILTKGGRVFALGENTWGQLGIGYTGGSQSAPTEIESLSDITEIAGGVAHSVALNSQGQVFTFGAMQGVAQVQGLPPISRVWSEGNNTYAEASDKRVFSWDYFGKLTS